MIIPPLQEILEVKEGENNEFKEAKNKYDFEKLVKYACAIANNGGGLIVLGVTDKRPRKIVGSKAFGQPERTRKGLIDRLHLNIDFEIKKDNGKRILIFSIPSRPAGKAVKYKGIYWTYKGDELCPMSEEQHQRILRESGHDFSADVCEKAVFSDLDADAIEEFRRRWIKKSGNTSYSTLSREQLLRDCEAIVRDGITYAALILFGTHEALGRLLGQSEVIFEYRSTEASGPAQQREEFRKGFFSYYDRLWELINIRNDLQHFQDGLFVMDVQTFDERAIREAILNAVSHRDYQMAGSVFIRQYPRRLTIDSPGGFPPDVTIENILDRQSPRNRRIAEIFSKCGLVERSGQGMNLIFETSIKNGKMLPDFKGTDEHHVVLTLDGQVQDPKFLKLLEDINKETLESFCTQDFLVLNLVYKEKKIPDNLKDRIPRLVDLGIIEKASKGRYILGRKYYKIVGKKGVYTRKKGLDREMRKALLLKHIRDNKKTGSKLAELCEVLPNHSYSQVQRLIRSLKKENKIYKKGITSASRWYPTQEKS